MHFDYTTVGHVTVDVTADGARRAGGSAFYSALQAARLGHRTLIITQGVVAEIEDLLAPYRTSLELQIMPARQTTTLQSGGDHATHKQRLLAWAGRIGENVEVDTSILHLAPVARETPSRWLGSAGFIGLTPQGLVRSWGGAGEIRLVPLAPDLLPERWDAIVISETERDSCAHLVPGAVGGASGESRSAARRDQAQVAARERGVVAVTAAAGPTTLYLPGGEIARTQVPGVAEFHDDVGAGDVFAAAFFIALCEGRPAPAAAAFANAAAAVRIAGPGADAIGDRSAVEARLRAAADV